MPINDISHPARSAAIWMLNQVIDVGSHTTIDPSIGAGFAWLVVAWYLIWAPSDWPFGSMHEGWGRGALGIAFSLWATEQARAAQARWQVDGWSPRAVGASVLAGLAATAGIGFLVWAGWTFAAVQL